MLRLETTTRYRKDRKLMKKQGKDLSLLDDVITKLQSDQFHFGTNHPTRCNQRGSVTINNAQVNNSYNTAEATQDRA